MIPDHSLVASIHLIDQCSVAGIDDMTLELEGACHFIPDLEGFGHEPEDGTSLGTGFCWLGNTFNAVTIPSGMCCSMWQWNCQTPGAHA